MLEVSQAAFKHEPVEVARVCDGVQARHPIWDTRPVGQRLARREEVPNVRVAACGLGREMKGRGDWELFRILLGCLRGVATHTWT